MEKTETRFPFASPEAGLLARVVQPELDNFTPEAARALLNLQFSREDRARMHELAVKNQEDALTPSEQQELDSFCRVGRLLDLLAAKARLTLQRSGLSA